jgi:hypothetical protein
MSRRIQLGKFIITAVTLSLIFPGVGILAPSLTLGESSSFTHAVFTEFGTATW